MSLKYGFMCLFRKTHKTEKPEKKNENHGGDLGKIAGEFKKEVQEGKHLPDERTTKHH